MPKLYFALHYPHLATQYWEVRNGFIEIEPTSNGWVSIKVSRDNQSIQTSCAWIEVRNDIPDYEKPQVIIEFPLE